MIDHCAGKGLFELAEQLGVTPRQYLALERGVRLSETLEGPGLDRVRAWLANGSPPADRGALAYAGDPTIGATVRQVVDRLPEPVAHHVVTRCLVLGVGAESVGWCSPWPGRTPTAPLLVVLSGQVTDAVVAHELAHAWQNEPRPELEPAERARLKQEYAIGVAAIIREGSLDVLVSVGLDRERAADRAATAWGFPIDTCSFGIRTERERDRYYEVAADAPAEEQS